jgi:pimeloyl-ACP methyl ester carboxylesterase
MSSRVKSLVAALIAGICVPSFAEAKNLYATQFEKEAQSKALCEGQPGRIHVRHKLGKACLAFTVTQGREQLRRAVIFIDGDVPHDLYANKYLMATNLAARLRDLQKLADREGVRIVRIERLGINGSSGNHGRRGGPQELHAMNAAVDALKTRLGLDEIVFAGQSRGSLIGASLLTLGRNDVRCAVLGSGVYEHVRFIHRSSQAKGLKVNPSAIRALVYDPSARLGAIKRDPSRRVFVLGDPADAQVPFDQQARFAQSLRAYGHHGELIEIRATDANRHGAMGYALNVAAFCANGKNDAGIRTFVDNVRTSIERRLVPATSTSSPVTPAIKGPAGRQLGSSYAR